MTTVLFQRWGRQYRRLYLTNETVNILKALNCGNETYKSALFDRQFVKVLMKDVFKDITTWQPNTILSCERLNFIKGMLNPFVINRIIIIMYNFTRTTSLCDVIQFIYCYSRVLHTQN